MIILLHYSIQQGDTITKIANRFHIQASELSAVNPGINPRYLQIGQLIQISTESDHPMHSEGTQQGNNHGTISRKELELRNLLRQLWEEHVAWTRMVILSAAANAPDFNDTVSRLLRNATDMASALQPLYGANLAEGFGRLIQAHLTIALQLVMAAKEGNTQAAQDAENRWYQNADAIAEYVNRMNPYIDKEEFKNMLYHHLAQTKQEAVERLRHNYSKDIALYDQIEIQALDMADAMSIGIIRQFPTLF